MGLSSERARFSASGDHGYQSTGLPACWRRYGEGSAARRLRRPSGLESLMAFFLESVADRLYMGLVNAAVKTTQLRKIYPAPSNKRSPGGKPPAASGGAGAKRPGVVALDGLDLEIAEGELFGLLGPNGAGKTTTIGILTTRVRPTSGDAVVAGADVTREAGGGARPAPDRRRSAATESGSKPQRAREPRLPRGLLRDPPANRERSSQGASGKARDRRQRRVEGGPALRRTTAASDACPCADPSARNFVSRRAHGGPRSARASRGLGAFARAASAGPDDRDVHPQHGGSGPARGSPGNRRPWQAACRRLAGQIEGPCAGGNADPAFAGWRGFRSRSAGQCPARCVSRRSKQRHPARVLGPRRRADSGADSRRRAKRAHREGHPPFAAQPGDALHLDDRKEARLSAIPEKVHAAPPGAGKVFYALLLRDLVVNRRELPYFLLRTTLQPLLFTIVFGFLLPRMSRGCNVVRKRK